MVGRMLATGLWMFASIAVAHEGASGDDPGAVRVESVIAGSAAAAAGVQAGDVIVGIDGRAIETLGQLQQILAQSAPGDLTRLTVHRDGETMSLNLTLGSRPDGGASMGVRLNASGRAAEALDADEAERECLGWLEATYHIDSTLRDLGLELADSPERIRACVSRDARRMGRERAVQACDSIFKVHCAGVDLLAEIGEALVDGCEDELRGLFGVEPTRYKGWNTCGQHKVFDRYSLSGEVSAARACSAAFLDECGTSLDAVIQASELTADQQTFVDCCAADTLGARDRGDVGVCTMIDESFSRGPCQDRPVCVNRLTQEWLHCSVLDGEPAAWIRWGGPHQDFRAPASGIAAQWPDGGPATLWSRELGGGYSAILVEGGRIYTLYRSGDEEAAICIDAANGETVWEYRYSQPTRKGHVDAYGRGPNATPLISGDLLVTVGVAGKVHALDKRHGTVVWRRDLWGDEFGGTFLIHGYSSSPVAHAGRVIVPVGGDNAGLVAFDLRDGSLAWRAHSFENSYSSPRIMELAGEQQIVVLMAEELIGVDPGTGALRWRYTHANQWKHNVTMPSAVDGDTLFLSTPQTGARGLRLVPDGDRLRAEEIWSERRVQFYHVSSVQDGDWVYGSSGTAGPSFMVAVNIRSGTIGWRERGFAKANCVEADGKLLILDEDGVLYLARATPEKLDILGKTELLSGVAWTVPTVVGSTLYVRDTERILAVDLG